MLFDRQPGSFLFNITIERLSLIRLEIIRRQDVTHPLCFCIALLDLSLWELTKLSDCLAERIFNLRQPSFMYFPHTLCRVLLIHLLLRRLQPTCPCPISSIKRIVLETQIRHAQLSLILVPHGLI